MSIEDRARELANAVITTPTLGSEYRIAVAALTAERVRALEDALAAKPEQPMNEDFNKWATLWWLGVTDKEVAIRALLPNASAADHAGNPRPAVAALAGGGEPKWTREKDIALRLLLLSSVTGDMEPSVREFYTNVRRAAFPETPDV